jgi:hypothetical protein
MIIMLKNRKLRIVGLILLVLLANSSGAQIIGTSLPRDIKTTESYLFYLHGGVVTVLGNNAINQSAPEWGPYEYLNILDSLRSRRFNVISENRKEGIDDSIYVNRIAAQIDSLSKGGVKADRILVIGASAGWNIALHVSAKLKNKDIRYVIMGGCWPDSYEDYQGLELYGHFLSIIEKSDPHKTCSRIFDNREQLSSFQEIELNTGLSHGFMYKGRKEWIDPIVRWFRKM